MTAPANVVITFDQPDGGYPPGATVTAALTGISENSAPVTRVLEGTLTDAATGEETTVQGSFTVATPNQLTASVSETDNNAQWAAGPASQDGAAFTQIFTTRAS